MLVLKKTETKKISATLNQGAAVVFPTETSYGLGCDATNKKAVDRIYEIKGRDYDKPLLAVVDSVKEAKKYLMWNDTLEKLAQKYWPGPLTIVGRYRKKFFGKNLARGVVSKDNTVAIRVTSNEFLRAFLKQFKRPLVATSANVAGKSEIYDSTGVVRAFDNRPIQPDVLVDGGVLPEVLPTTVVSVFGGEIKMLRQGAVNVKN